MQNPKSNGYAETVNSKDNGGEDYTHGHSTVVSHAAYLMHTDLKKGTSLSIEQLSDLWYNTMLILPSNCTFSLLRQYMEMTAETLNYTSSQKERISVAFDKVGIAVVSRCQEALVDAFTRYADGSSMQEIADELNLKGVRTNRGNKITINVIARMLHNRKYIGEFKQKDIVKPGGIPAIVTEELFDRVQKRMTANKKAPAKHKAEDEYLLTTKLFCGKCRCYMVGESGTSHSSQVHRYYKCVSVKKHRGCDKKTVKKDWIENLVIEQIKSIVFNDELIESIADAIMELQGQESTTLPLLRKQYADTQKAIDNMLNAIQQGILTPSTKERLESFEKKKNELSVEIVKEEMAKPAITKDQIVFWLHRFRKLDTKKREHRRRLIDSFVNAVYLYDDRMIITFNYKDGSRTITLAELEKSALGSDINVPTPPNEKP